MALREQGKQRRKQRIVEAAQRLLQRGGRAELSTAALASEAEVSVATLYNLVGSLDQILDLLVADLTQNFEATLGALDSGDQPMGFIADYIDASYDFYAADSDARRATLRMILETNVSAGISEHSFATAGELKRRLADNIARLQREQLLDNDIAAGLLAEQLQVTLVACTQNWVAGVISLQRSRLVCHYHACLLLLGVASGDFAIYLNARVDELQKAIAREDRKASQALRKPA